MTLYIVCGLESFYCINVTLLDFHINMHNSQSKFIKTKFKACIQLHIIKIPDSLKLWKESLNSDEKQLNYIQRNEQLPLISSQVMEK